MSKIVINRDANVTKDIAKNKLPLMVPMLSGVGTQVGTLQCPRTAERLRSHSHAEYGNDMPRGWEVIADGILSC